MGSGRKRWARFNGCDGCPISQKLALDVEYLRRCFFEFDLQMVLCKAVKLDDLKASRTERWDFSRSTLWAI